MNNIFLLMFEDIVKEQITLNKHYFEITGKTFAHIF